MDATLTDALWSTYFQLPNSDETSAARWIDLRIWKSSTPANAISAAIDNNGTSADGGNRASKTRSPVRITSVTTDAINETAAALHIGPQLFNLPLSAASHVADPG